MVVRKRIGLIFTVDRNWMGGVNYILNLLNALNFLSEQEKPEITLLCKSEEDYLYAREITGYPHLRFIPVLKTASSIVRRVANKLGRIFIGRDVVPVYNIKENYDIIYPVKSKFQLNSKSPQVYWIPDFQELHLPQLFSKKQLKKRNKNNQQIIATGAPIVLSSNDALKDLNHFYPESKNLLTPVFHFAASVPAYDERLKDNILNKFGISEKYFFCANQIWQHKNHLILLKAINVLKKSGKKIHVICSGNKSDYRNEEYAKTLFQYVSENNLNDNVKFLGLIERTELICLMKESAALIQPSLFEGWNTGIEEAKALNKFIIASDLPVHREQVNKNVIFFNPHNPFDLAEILWNTWSSTPKVEEIDYQDNILKAAREFMRIVDIASKTD